MRRALAALAGVLALAPATAGCGGEGTASAPGRLVVSAAASLREPLLACRDDAEGVRVDVAFGGSDELAAQIRRGVRPDVFAAADTQLPEQLAGEGLVERPRVFAGNELVVAVPRGSAVARLEDLGAPGVAIAVGSPSVPVGGYTREVLRRAGAATRAAVLANVRTEEPDVRGVVGKLRQGAADAGFVYATDVAAAGDALRAVQLPAGLRPNVAYGAAVVRGAPNPAAARRYVDGLVRGVCQDALRRAGFAPAP